MRDNCLSDGADALVKQMFQREEMPGDKDDGGDKADAPNQRQGFMAPGLGAVSIALLNHLLQLRQVFLWELTLFRGRRVLEQLHDVEGCLALLAACRMFAPDLICLAPITIAQRSEAHSFTGGFESLI